jgi:small subunit ribosomal protein S6
LLREFETTFILQPEITDEGVQAICARVDQILERSGAVRLLYDDDGKRRLAYEIKHFQKGHYLTLHYFDSGKTVPEIERSLRLDESVLRFLTVRVADEVGDVEERKKQAAEEEKIRAERAAERAALDAQEAREREAEEALRLGPQPDGDDDESEDDE